MINSTNCHMCLKVQWVIGSAYERGTRRRLHPGLVDTRPKKMKICIHYVFFNKAENGWSLPPITVLVAIHNVPSKILTNLKLPKWNFNENLTKIISEGLETRGPVFVFVPWDIVSWRPWWLFILLASYVASHPLSFLWLYILTHALLISYCLFITMCRCFVFIPVLICF